MARTKMMPRKGERERVRQVRTRMMAQSHPQRPLTPVDPPAPAQETPPYQDEMSRRVAEVEQLEEAGSSPQSLPS